MEQYKRLTIRTPVFDRTLYDVDDVISEIVNDKIEEFALKTDHSELRIVNVDSVIDTRSQTDAGIDSIITVVHLAYK